MNTNLSVTVPSAAKAATARTRATKALATVLGLGVIAAGSIAVAAGRGDAQQAAPTVASTASTSMSTASSPRPAPPIDGRSAEGEIDVRMIHRPGQAVSGTDTGRWTSMYDFMSFVVQDTASVWNWYYQQWGKGQSSARYSFPLPGVVVRTACKDASGQYAVTDDDSAFYCGADDTIYISQARARWYWTRGGGDFAVATAIAHEYGHNVQSELGISRQNLRSTQFEQHADCLSGAFARQAYFQGDSLGQRASRECDRRHSGHSIQVLDPERR